MTRFRPFLPFMAVLALTLSAQGQDRVGTASEGATLVATGQRVRPAGKVLAFPGRPLDLALAQDGSTLLAKTDEGVLVLDPGAWTLRQSLPYAPKDSASMHGLALAPDGRSAWVSTGNGFLAELRLRGQVWSWGRRIGLPSKDKGSAYPCGLALSADGRMAYVALSRANALAVVDLVEGRLQSQISVGVAPYAVALSADGARAYVSNWGGRLPRAGERSMASSGTPVLVDGGGLPASGTVSQVDVAAGKVVAEVEVGLHPAQILLDEARGRIFVANANSDSVSILGMADVKVRETVSLRPDPALPFGSLPNAMALTPDGQKLLVANGGNNAVAVVELAKAAMVAGFIPTGWFPAAVATDGKALFIANAKGDGSRQGEPGHRKWAVGLQRGSLQKVALPTPAELKAYSADAAALSLEPQALRSLERGRRGLKPRPVPARVGEPSVFKHVVYVLKENRTYDQVFGDLKQANGDPDLCIYGRDITPNHHALAEGFVLLDNYYCNGIVSADGHQWATQGITSDYQEKAFGEWARSYDFGTDPLAFAPTPFLWDQALLRGLSFRNYGEFDFPTASPKVTWDDFRQSGAGATFQQSISLEALRPYTSPTFPGWEMRIPDQVRVDAFLKEFREAEASGQWPNLIFVYLPQDHTRGTAPGAPTPRAHLADNDLALGRLVEAISKSRFWKDTCIFVNEDDPQDGFDHVDGHRSLCLVISPYTKRGKVVSRFYNQTSVLHTMELMLGLPPMNQLDGAAPAMQACFTAKPDFRPFQALPNRVPLEEKNPSGPAISMDFSRPDRIDDNALNRVLWMAEKGAAPYPAHLAGGHGKGLKRLGLKLDTQSATEDDD
ncbi:bifunctional YncE family protein/alkaline phosphatase family protein [Geothrix sp. PMB-07]|uniref:bifunctional YncE family protein/alkaline phosphatase family protein n=1 Tax=Geothrix sp. PMB-07 TaxID=3068640 RepID=UPI00274215D3|nr:alkaline phosphatase family protein [Geothrix sp. PMB-07]WLT30672.1 alkaline phosphatase family protein [Geothrix sp. PMB-07]